LSAQHYHSYDLGLPALGHATKFSSVMREIRGQCNRASAFHVHLMKSQFHQHGIVHSKSEKENDESMISEISPIPASEPSCYGTESVTQSVYDCAKSEDNEPMISEISPTPALEPLLNGTEKEAQSFYDCAHSVMLENLDSSSGSPLVTFTLDSASDIHVIQLREAIKYFSKKSNSNLKVLGVSGNVTRADLQGHLVIVVEDDDGKKHNIDLGIAHGMEQVPVNLLSVSLLLRSGCIVHLGENHCY